jgi:hypothetical protein
MEELGVASSNDHDIRTVPMPDVDEMRAMIRTAAARASQPIREAIDKGLDKYELFAWWGAHRRRHQQQLPTLTTHEFSSHPGSLLNPPDGTDIPTASRPYDRTGPSRPARERTIAFVGV